MNGPGFFGATNQGMGGGILLLVLIFFAYYGYRFSARQQLLRGTTPWGFPSIVWALICFAIGPVGLIVEVVAGHTTRTRLVEPATSPAASSGMRAPRSYEPMPPLRPLTRAESLPRPDDGSGKTPIFGWYADPTENHELRYWDGRRWSDLVADHGHRGVDPLETPAS